MQYISDAEVPKRSNALAGASDDYDDDDSPNHINTRLHSFLV